MTRPGAAKVRRDQDVTVCGKPVHARSGSRSRRGRRILRGVPVTEGLPFHSKAVANGFRSGQEEEVRRTSVHMVAEFALGKNFRQQPK